MNISFVTRLTDTVIVHTEGVILLLVRQQECSCCLANPFDMHAPYRLVGEDFHAVLAARSISRPASCGNRDSRTAARVNLLF